MRSPFARFCQTTGELTGRGPRPPRLLVDSGDKNVLIFLAFTFRPGFDEQDQLGARHTMSHLQPMGRQFVTRRLPFLRPRQKEIPIRYASASFPSLCSRGPCWAPSPPRDLKSAGRSQGEDRTGEAMAPSIPPSKSMGVGANDQRMFRHCLQLPRISRFRAPCILEGIQTRRNSTAGATGHRVQTTTRK